MLQKKYKKNIIGKKNLDHLYRVLTIGCSGSGKTNSLFNLISQQPDMDKIYLYAKDPYEAKY